ncbi:MAG TPA: hypothetical protein VEP90_15240 [Methylomirabilota bacterium]|nr:hypothetical protein [Methylomirabilota bacterium]
MSNAYILQLKTEIRNPTPDRRSKDWHKATVIPAGTRFIVQNDQTIMTTNQRYAWIGTKSELGTLIVANSERVEPQIRDGHHEWSLREIKVVDADYDYNGDGILEALLKMGRITRQDFRDVRAFMEKTEDTDGV